MILLDKHATDHPEPYSDSRFIPEDQTYGVEMENGGVKEFPARFASEMYHKSNGIAFQRRIEILKEAMEKGLVLTARSVKKLYKAEAKGKVAKVVDTLKKTGDTKCPAVSLPITLSALQSAFENDKRFHGNVPKIIKSMACAADFYGIGTSQLVDRFSIPTVRTLLSAGTSEVETILCYTQLDGTSLSNLLSAPQMAYHVAKLLEKDILTGNEKCKNAALWICKHTQSDPLLIKKVTKNAEVINILPDSSVDFVETQLDNIKAWEEIKNIEKTYKKSHFKFSNCECQLKMTEIETERFRAEILKADDPRQVQVGYSTECCQHLEGIGESAMMHGLLNPKAGFWILTNKTSGRVLAQAEVWEENEDTLVFDNIEFANDADIALYKNAIGKWLAASPYATVKMGTGYNELARKTGLRMCGGVKPSVTPYEVYVLSYEPDAGIPDFCERTAPNKKQVEDADEEYLELPSVKKARELLESGEIDYYDYLYCDSERSAMFMKENGVLEPYFQDFEHTAEQEREE